MTLLHYNTKKLSSMLQSNGIREHHAKPILQNFWAGQADPIQSTGLPKSLANLGWDFTNPVQLTDPQQSKFDGSVKFLTKLQDGLEVETVLMPEHNRITLCISSQVGCQQACRFCNTGRMGLLRQLRTEEMVGQVAAANAWIRCNPGWLQGFPYQSGERVSNVVFMGMGEPFDNVEYLNEAVSVLLDPNAAAIAPRKLTVSTAGHLDGIKLFDQVHPKVPIALSLHAATARAKLLPIEKRFPVSRVLDYLSDRALKNKSFVMIQYTLIQKVNDHPEDAQALVELLQNRPAKVNLIPFNEFSASRFNSPEADRVQRFRDILQRNQIRSMIRYSKAQDVAGACGQLVVNTKS